MSKLFSAANAHTVRTWNGMRTLETSENSVTDLFFKWGGSRGNFENLKPTLASAMVTDKNIAVRTMLYGRDVREGAGERQLFRDAINFLAENEMITIDEARRIMVKIPALGRWDDIFVFVDTVLENAAFSFIAHAIFDENDALAAKWTPRKGPVANKFRKFLGLSPKFYRKALVARSNTVEQLMSSRNWDEINFSHVPSVAAGRYIKAFTKHCPDAYAAYKNALIRQGEPDVPVVKINAGAVYPYDVIKSLRLGDVSIASEQWKALPNFMDRARNNSILPVIDVSGSMMCIAGGPSALWMSDKNGVTCMDVAISLGLYISERNTGPFKDEFITFSSRPSFQKVHGNLAQRYKQMKRADWQGSTNIAATFDLILKAARSYNLSEADMPRTVLIISDMQFNMCVRHDDTAMEMIERKYREAGYKIPNVVFWNVNAGPGVPVKFDKSGTALVSGFSPSIMKSIIASDEFSPMGMLKTTVMKSRYDW